MTTLGRNVKITAPKSAREAARAMFAALDAKHAAPSPTMDVFALDGGSIGFEYVADASALTAAQMRIAPWLELAVADVDAARERLAALGLERVAYRDHTHAYFAGPGGFVFRLAARTA